MTYKAGGKNIVAELYITKQKCDIMHLPRCVSQNRPEGAT